MVSLSSSLLLVCTPREGNFRLFVFLFLSLTFFSPARISNRNSHDAVSVPLIHIYLKFLSEAPKFHLSACDIRKRKRKVQIFLIRQEHHVLVLILVFQLLNRETKNQRSI